MQTIKQIIDTLEKIVNKHINLNETKVIFIDNDKQWSIAALIFDNTPHLGIRWINCKNGYPKGGWFIIPNILEKSILDDLNLNNNDRKLIDDFLSKSGTISSLSCIKNFVSNEV